MAVPKKRTSKSRKNMRRAHDFLSFTAAVMVCPNCGATKLMHRVCASCGYYRGRLMFDAPLVAGAAAASSDSVVADDIVASDISVDQGDDAPSTDE